MSEQAAEDVPSTPVRQRLEVAIAEMRGMLNTVVAQHNARLDENARQIAENKHAIGRLEVDVSQLKLAQAAAVAVDQRDDRARSFGLTRGQLVIAWLGLGALLLFSTISTVLAIITILAT